MWNYGKLFPDLMMWLLVAAFSFWAIFQVYETYFRLRRARANRVANSSPGRTELRLQVPPHIAHAARGRGLRVQLALSDREMNNLDNATLTELHPSSPTPSMTEEEINAMPIHNYNVNIPASANSSAAEASSYLDSKELHAYRIKEWLKKQYICPDCKALICSKKQAVQESEPTAAAAASASASGGGGVDSGGSYMV